jgi:hypothetical protein
MAPVPFLACPTFCTLSPLFSCDIDYNSCSIWKQMFSKKRFWLKIENEGEGQGQITTFTITKPVSTMKLSKCFQVPWFLLFCCVFDSIKKNQHFASPGYKLYLRDRSLNTIRGRNPGFGPKNAPLKVVCKNDHYKMVSLVKFRPTLQILLLVFGPTIGPPSLNPIQFIHLVLVLT